MLHDGIRLVRTIAGQYPASIHLLVCDLTIFTVGGKYCGEIEVQLALRVTSFRPGAGDREGMDAIFDAGATGRVVFWWLKNAYGSLHLPRPAHHKGRRATRRW
jgi:hypothetical protein